MNPRYLNTVDQIYHHSWTLERLIWQRRLRVAVDQLWPDGHPTRLVQVGGTSGKGSVSRFLEAGFSLVGSSGSFTGPHLFDYRERFRTNGAIAEPDAVASAWEDVVRPICLDERERRGRPFTYLEINTLIALVLFARANLDWAAMEVGVGGRYDRTSALPYLANALTNVGRDHEHVLGSEPWQRAMDKAGMARPGVPLFTSERDPEILEVIAGVCSSVGAPLHVVGEAEAAAVEKLAGGPIPPGSILSAEHQRQNAALALAVLGHLLPDLDPAAALKRMAEVEITGRLTEMAPGVFADVAHNPNKVAALAREIESRLPDTPRVFVVGVSGRRQAIQVLSPLLPMAHHIVITRSDYKGQNPNAIRDSLASEFPLEKMLVVEDAQFALAAAKELCPPGGTIILTGSTYMIEQALNPDPYLRHINGTFGWR